MISNLVDDEIVLIKVEEMNYLSEQKKSQEQKKKKIFFSQKLEMFLVFSSKK